MANAEGKDETLERNLASLPDRLKQVADRGFTISLNLLEFDLLVALRERENVRWLLDPPLLEEKLDLLLAQSFDIEGAARTKKLQVFDLLVRTAKFACAAGAGALLAGRGLLAHDVSVQIARALLREMIGLGIPWTLVDDHIDNLRNNVAGALHDDAIADANIAAFAQFL